MSKSKPGRTTPKIPGSRIYWQDSQAALPGNFVYIHRQQYHVFVGLQEVLVTADRDQALNEAARATLS